ncbi:MAG: YdjY domain-containing protein [Pirellulaceae bacterium]
MRCFARWIVLLVCLFAASNSTLVAQWEGREEELQAVEKAFGVPEGLIRLDPVSRVWADKKKQRIIVDGYIALDAGQLEMFACPIGTKEHESVVAVFSKAFVIHAGLLAVGAKKGTPVQWDPEYKSPTGSEIQVLALWKDPKTGEKQTIDARKWIREAGTKDKILDRNFVFAGSTMWKDPDSGKEFYQAESGDLICVSNFSTATLDVPIESSAKAAAGLLFDVFKPRVPPRFTPVRLVLQVVDGKKKQESQKIEGSEDAKPASVKTPPIQ